MHTATPLAAPTALADTANIVSRTMARLRIDPHLHTDPELLADILRTDMRLDDLASFTRRLGEKLNRPQPMHAFLGAMADGIDHRQPLLKSFLSEVLKAGLIPSPDDDGVKSITRVLHHAYLLEELTVAMADDVGFTHDVSDHIFAKRQEAGIRRSFFGSILDIYRITRSVFGPAKAKTMDYVFVHSYGNIRRGRSGPITGVLLNKRRILLMMNILEATITDFLRGNRANALAGLALTINTVTHIRVLPRSKFVLNYVRDDWTQLYESWNLAFVIGNLPNCGLLLPKLLIPSVINTPPENYLFPRGLSLWVTVSFHLFALRRGRSTVMPNHEPLARLLGELNGRYAKAFMARPHRFARMQVL